MTLSKIENRAKARLEQPEETPLKNQRQEFLSQVVKSIEERRKRINPEIFKSAKAPRKV